VIPELSIDKRVWQAACTLASLSRHAGKTIPASDIVVFACARHHGVEIEHADGHFEMLGAL
jgi:predicted nucleic acid-binding protein